MNQPRVFAFQPQGELDVIFEFSQGLALEILLVNKGPQIVVSQKFVLVSDRRCFVVVLFAHGLESIFGINVF